MKNTAKFKGLYEYQQAVQSQLDTILEPLKLFNLNNFGYGKITRDGKFFRLGNNPTYTDIYFREVIRDFVNTQRDCVHSHNFSQAPHSQMYMWNVDKQHFCQLRNEANMGNGISFYNFTGDYIEIWSVGGTPEDTGLSDFYLNNLALLNRFFLYFKSQAKDLLDLSDHNKTVDLGIQRPVLAIPQLDDKRVELFNEQISQNKYLLSNGTNDFTLTLRELECLFYKNMGLTAKEVAQKLNISYRTVETHIENIKTKSGMQKIQHLLNFCKNEGII